jgi:hypothetical protein
MTETELVDTALEWARKVVGWAEHFPGDVGNAHFGFYIDSLRECLDALRLIGNK